MKRLRSASLIALSLALSGTAAAAPVPPTPAAAPAGDVKPLATGVASRLPELRKAASDYRGLAWKTAVPEGAVDEAALKRKMVEEVKTELPAAKLAVLEASLKAFGLLPESLDLATYFPELLTSQVGGFYDPKQKYLVVVDRPGGLLGPELTQEYGPEMAQKLEDSVMVHELTHALQDQHFDLQGLTADDAPLTDAGAAKLALVEGDATLTMFDFVAGMRLETLPDFEPLLRKMMGDPQQLIAMSPGMPGAKEMEAAPAWFRDTLLFSYLDGYLFVLKVKSQGGQKLLDYAFTQDPPRSTEQILHPEKWYGDRDDPVGLPWPDLSPELPGYRKVAEAGLGEEGIKVLLRQALGDDAKAAGAAAGWGGDRFAVYEPTKDSGPAGRLLAWMTAWDTPVDAAEFADAARSLTPGWTVVRSAPTRVDLLRGALPAEKGARVLAKLKAVAAQMPENRSIDLARFASPPAHPALLDDPAMQGELKKVLARTQPAGAVSADGKSYVNRPLGVTLRIPASASGWAFREQPQMPAQAIELASPDGFAHVDVGSQPFPMAMTNEDLAPLFEMGLKAAVPGYRRLGVRTVEVSGVKGYELRYEGGRDGKLLHAAQRLFLRGTSMLIVSAVAPVEHWSENEKVLEEALASVALSEPVGAAPAAPPG